MSPDASRLPEEHRPLVGCESTAHPCTVISRWSALVDGDPDAPAVVSDSGTLTRGRLDQQAAGLARILELEVSVPPDTARPRVVAVLAPHGEATVTAVLAVLRAGFGYLVLDPRWPSARIDSCCRAARPLAVLVTAATTDRAQSAAVPLVIDIDAHAGTVPEVRTDAALADATPSATDPDTVAYLLFTSGSTGTPKAVQQSHRGVLVCADNQRAALQLRPSDVLTLLTPFCYDMAAVDLWSALLNGATIAPYDLATRGLTGLDDFLTRHGVTVFHCAPTVLRTLGLLGDRIDGSVHTVLLGGEAAVRRDVEVARTLFGPAVTIAGGYGSTEASFSTMFVADRDREPRSTVEPAGGPGSPLPMGQPLPGFTVELDATGEILVTGRGVALGYLPDSAAPATEEARFSDAGSGRRTFRTGDLGERIDGLLYHRGRLDRQIKVRGIRIDPAEVEAILLDVPGVTGALVGPAAAGTGAGSITGAEHQALVAQLTVGAAVVLSTAELHRRLSAQLPAAMVPSRFDIVERLDVTDTGKRVRPQTIDAVDPMPSDRSADALLDRVRRTVADVLGIDATSIDPRLPLLESGAHSLDLVRIHAALSSWGEIQLVELFGLGSVTAIAGHLHRPGGTLGASAAAGSDSAASPATAPATRPAAPRAGRRAARVPPRGGR